MGTTRVTFPGATGDRLVGRLEMPVGEPPLAFALFAHCFTCSKDLKAAVNVSRALAARRIGVLRFDFTGIGESEGDFAETGFASNVEDLVAAAEFLARERRAPEILVGHSLGGAAVLQAAERIPESVAVSTIAAPSDPSHVRRHFTEAVEEIRREGEAEVEIGGRRFTLGRRFLQDLEETRMERTVRELGRALLLFHSPVDDVVGIENAARLYRWARHPKSFVSLDRADHLLLDPEESRYVGEVLAAWARKYLRGRDRDEASERRGAWSAGEEGVAVRIGRERYRTDVMAGGHALVADEPESAGGTGLGPSPYDLLTAALGTCTAITLRMYADRKEWPLEEAEIRLAHAKVRAEDGERSGEASAKVDRIEQSVAVSGPLEEGQRERLLEIADRCPVHRTLERGVIVETRPAGGEAEEAAGAGADGAAE